MKIQLIYSPNDKKYQDLRTGYDSYPPPVGLAILSSYLKRFSKKEVTIQIIDGNITKISEILEILDGDLIGFSDWFTNHNNSIFLAKKAKIKNPNSKIIFGGPNASNLGERILRNHPEIDYVVYGDGEEALLGIVNNSSLIPNLWYRLNGKVLFTFKKNTLIEKTVPFDFEDLYETDIQKYNSKHKYYNENIGLTPVPISSIRGCLKAISFGACSYCAIPRFNKMSILNPKLAWNQIGLLNEKYGINYFFETGDNFLNGNYHRRLLESKPTDLKVNFRIYADFESLNLTEIDILEELGVVEIFIGLESISSEVVEKANRSSNKQAIINTISYLHKKKIRVFLPFLFGLPGESKQSIIQNFEFAYILLNDYDNIQRVLFSLAIPLIGTSWFNDLQTNQIIIDRYLEITGRNLIEDDQMDYELLVLLSLEKYTSIKFIDLYRILKTPLSTKIKDRIAGFGCLEEVVLNLESEINLKNIKSLVS